MPSLYPGQGHHLVNGINGIYVIVSMTFNDSCKVPSSNHRLTSTNPLRCAFCLCRAITCHSASVKIGLASGDGVAMLLSSS
jgi:hypothetical protein